jgi:Cd2+/Zn2+-exporting ATPase
VTPLGWLYRFKILPWLIQHARRTLAVIRQNIVFSLAVKAIFVVLTFAGFASLWAAIAATWGRRCW